MHGRARVAGPCTYWAPMYATFAGGGCTRTGGTCTETVGWQAATPRGCGSNGSYVTDCDTDCRVVSETRAQECR